MSDWQPEHDVELAEVYAGVYDNMPYQKALLADALTRMGERVLQGYLGGKESVDDVLDRIEKIEQPESGFHRFART